MQVAKPLIVLAVAAGPAPLLAQTALPLHSGYYAAPGECKDWYGRYDDGSVMPKSDRSFFTDGRVIQFYEGECAIRSVGKDGANTYTVTQTCNDEGGETTTVSEKFHVQSTTRFSLQWHSPYSGATGWMEYEWCMRGDA